MNTLQGRFTDYIGRNGETVLVDDTSRTVFFMQFKEGVTTHNDYMYLFAQVGEVQAGSIISRADNDFIVTHKDTNINNTYDKFLIRNITKYINLVLNDILVSVPAIIFDGIQRIEDNKYLSVVDGKLQMLIPDNEINSKIAINDRIIVFRQAWKVIGFTGVEDGLITVYLEQVLLSSEDDIINEIPDTYTEPVLEPTEAYYIDGQDYINNMSLKVYTGVKSENDVVVASIWNFSVEDNGYEVEFTVTGDNTCTIKNKVNSGNIVLTGVCDEETIIKEIELKGLW
jgi:hypothetical protein